MGRPRKYTTDAERKAAHVAQQLASKRDGRAQTNDIGQIPKCANPKLRKSCARDLLRFLITYLPARFPLAFSDDHKRVIALLQSTILGGGQFAVAMPRGSGKTTLIEGAATWALLYGHRRFIFVIGADGGAASQLMSSIKSELETNGERYDNGELDEKGRPAKSYGLVADFPEACVPIRKLDGIPQRARQQTSGGERTDMVWTRNELRLSKFASGGGSVVRMAGITGRIRGAKASMADGSQIRPDLVLVDDLQTDKSAKSPSQVATRLQALRSTILGLAGPDQTIACLAAVTVICKGDLADQVLDRQKHPEFQGLTTRLMHSMPTATALWDQYANMLRECMRTERPTSEATEFYRANQKAMDAGARAAWPERYDVKTGEISAIQRAMNFKIIRGEEAFAAEFQNAPLDPLAAGDVVQIEPALVLAKLNRHPRGIVPVEDTVLTSFADVQGPALYWMVCAWNPAFGGDILEYGTWPDQGLGYFTVREIEKTLEKAYPGGGWEAAFHAGAAAMCRHILGREYVRDNGTVARVEQMLMDANWGDSTPSVYSFCRRSEFASVLLPSHGRGFRAGERGMAEWKKNPGDRIGTGWRVQAPAKRQTRHVIFDAGYWKSFVAGRLLQPIGSTSSLGVYGSEPSAHRMLADHLSAERRVRVTANGRTVDEWRAKPHQDNHLLDCLVGCAVGASIRGVKLDEAAAVRRQGPTTAEVGKASIAAAVERVAPKPAPAAAPPSIGGWLDVGGGGWL